MVGPWSMANPSTNLHVHKHWSNTQKQTDRGENIKPSGEGNNNITYYNNTL